MVRPYFRNDLCAALLLSIGVLTGFSEPPDSASPAGQARVRQQVEVRDGRASFDLASPRTLVVVSALSGNAGPFSVRLKTEAVDAARPPQLLVAAKPRPRAAPAPLPRAWIATNQIPARERSFALLARDGDPASASNYTHVQAKLMAVGKQVQIYADTADAGHIDRNLLADLISTFDDHVYPLASQRFGSATDVDGDGRFTILISSWLDRMAGGRAKVDGFVREADLDLSLSSPFSNRCDMMYLNASLRPGPHARTVVAHEYTHAVVFSRKALDPRSSPGVPRQEEEGWLDEALAHLVEDLHGFSKSNIDYRVSAFLSAPERYRLVVEDYYAADLFRSHGNRGGTYLFLRWLADREGDQVIDALIRSELRGKANLEAATGRSFAELYRDWSVALFMSGIEPETSLNKGGLYHSIDLRGTIEDWILAGPRCSRIPAKSGAETWSMVGTSSHYAVIEGSKQGATHVEVTGSADAELQVTAIPLPDDLGAIDLSVRPIRLKDGGLSIRASVDGRGGSPVRLGALCWEALTPTLNAEASRGGLDMLGIASAFGGSALPTAGRKTSSAISLGTLDDSSGPTIFKAVGTDARGRRIAGWAELKWERDSNDLDAEPLDSLP